MASVRKCTWSVATGELKTACIVDCADNYGDRRRKHFKKAADAFHIHVEGQSGFYRAAAQKVTVHRIEFNSLKRSEKR
jgi:hypothetical protein